MLREPNYQVANVKKLFVILFLSFSTFFLRHNTSFSQPPLIINLSDAKRAIKEYFLTGQYDLEMDSIIIDAIRQVKNLKIENNSAFVFDIDETALSSFEYQMQYDFGFIRNEWDKWVEKANAPAIKQVKRFYDTLVSFGVKIIFLTGRPEKQRTPTINNLKKAGYVIFDTLICRNINEQGLTAREYKSRKRKELSEKGYKIIGTIGDQWSDLDGGYTILKIKLPNYMYKIE
ncbi:MAG: hypothetical protein N2517_09180 [Ignavibacteria bacterium]|nr:hypothetical protein [Ignavibacteria bacterium]